MKKRNAIVAVALVGAGLLLIPAAAASAATYKGISGQVNAAHILYFGANYRVHAAGKADMTSMSYNRNCSAGGGFDCLDIDLGLRNSAGTQVTSTGHLFNVQSAAQYFTTPSGSETIPAGTYAFNWEDVVDPPSSSFLPASWTGTYNG